MCSKQNHVRGVIQAYVGKSEDGAKELGVYISIWTIKMFITTPQFAAILQTAG